MDLDSDTIFYLVLGFFWAMYLWQSYLSARQRKVYASSTYSNVPNEIRSLMDETTFDKSRLYNLDKSNFGFWAGLYDQLEFTVILLCSVIPWLWYQCGEQLSKWDMADFEIIRSLLFSIYAMIFSFITSLPWSYYSTFVIEERHGFNKQTLPFFIKDKIKKLIVSVLIGFPIMAALIAIVKLGGDRFYIYAWFFTFVVVLVMMFIYPDFIAPLFDRYEPLPDGLLKEDIEKLAQEIGFPLTKLYVVEGSKRSAHSNAYFYGFWKNKRIVLYDTLLEDFDFPGSKKGEKASVPESGASEDEKSKKDGDSESTEKEGLEKCAETEKPEESESTSSKKLGCNHSEVLAVLSHELGHWKLNHINYNLLISQVNTFIMFFFFGQLMNMETLFSAFGFSHSAPVLLRLMIIFQFIFSPYNEVLNFIMTLLSRLFEFQADNFAVILKRGAELRSALVKLQKDNLGFPLNDWLFSAYNFSHPPLTERLRAIEETSKKDS